MVIYEYKKGALPDIGRCVLALGFFDGVHAAHRDLILCAKGTAESLGLPLGIFTFPAECGVKSGTGRLYGTKEKCDLLSGLGADFTVLCDFPEISGLTPEEFISDVLIGDMRCEVAVAGFNYRFGKGASGDSETLARLMSAHGKRAVIKDERTLGGATVSASRIRALIEEGEIEEANMLLGAPYHLSAVVGRGRGVGRTLRYPTVNTEISPMRITPRLGVYRTALPIDGKIYTGVTNVGVCPTFGERQVHAETYIVDFDGDLYGRDIKIYFLGYLRDERRFDSSKELIMQINIDKNKAIKENGEIKWHQLGLSLQ